MLKDVISFVLEACERLHMPLSLNFYPSVYQEGKFDVYSINFRGRPVINFTNKDFYAIPKAMRMKELSPLIRVGMVHNLGENSLKVQMDIPRRQGISVIRNGVLKYGA